MALTRRRECTEQRYIFLLAATGERKTKIKRGSLVPRGPDDAVAAFPERVLRIDSGGADIQRRCDVHDGQGATRMARSSRAKAREVIAAHQVGLFLQLINGELLQDFSALRIGNSHVFSSRT